MSRWSSRLRAALHPDRSDVVDRLVQLGLDAADAVEALHRWACAVHAGGPGPEPEELRQAAARASAGRRDLARVVSESFVLPIDPEEVLEISERLENLISSAYLTQREAQWLEVGLEPDLLAVLAHASACAAELPRSLAQLREQPARAAELAEAVLDRRWDVEDHYAMLLRRRSRSAAAGEDGPAQREIARRAEDLVEQVARVARRVVHTVAKIS